jgi:two-component system response regulator BaeR
MTPLAPPERRVLIVEDDVKIADMLANYLVAQGFQCRVCGNGLEAAGQARLNNPSVVLLDLMLPGRGGLAVCRDIRQFSAVPIIMVTARVDEIDRLLGLDTGADDYICKPFSPREVVARIKALLRRTEGALVTKPPSMLQINQAKQQIEWQGNGLALTQVEFRLMRLLLSRPDHVFARARLLDNLHEDLRDVSDRAIDSHIKNIRRKLEQAGVTGTDIASVYGVGYRLTQT